MLLKNVLGVNFQEAQDYLFSLGNEVSAMKLGLENIEKLLAALDDPHEKYVKVQVAGTNGKGSVCAFLNSICVHAGIRTGMFTSPHLVSITERVKIDGSDIADNDFAKYATRVRQTAETLVASGELQTIPTYFEQVTAIALLAFAEADIELAIVETGLGGRLDATTAAKAQICAITRIDYDHQQYLGDTIEEIAAEKAAIIHGECTPVVLHQTRPVEQVIAGRCREVGVDPVWATTDIIVKRERDVFPWLIATFAGARASYGNVLLMGMMGEHQIENASIAIAVAEVLQETGFDLTGDDIFAGLQNATHPGRLERIDRFLLDGAHNIGGARALRAYLDEFIKQPITMIFGAMNDKDVAEVASILFPKAERLILTKPTNSRAIDPSEVLRSTGHPRAWTEPEVRSAMARAYEVAGADDVILITGSLYLVGEARQVLTRSTANS